MEIKCVKKRKIEYPRINEISNRRVKCAIPDKWIKLGITSFLFNVLMRGKALAASVTIDTSKMEDVTVVIAGVLPEYDPIYEYVKGGCNIVSLISTLAFVISAIMIIYKKAKAKKQNMKIKVNKKLKIIFIISILSIILSIGIELLHGLAK